ncbi:AfsR/SARP family transcriptional regulator [Allokutzneria albata]|uniref:DNA-binding transcriptional activator of the SARP family n=1 Tax=Allokutzneria albata TaxID=211114 RepID=A0A1G9VXH8_ALLAB|nr:AfsR/SARP family transcriptional regulator [Allokutzneria albata]SDM76646.1 DNA-binding transcriptional activator of the SARP family [Allokutzneria albata]
MDFRILGPVEVWEAGSRLDPPPPKSRQILAMLLLDAGRITPAERLIDAVWGDEPPPHVRKALQVHISHLRQLLPSISLRYSPPGYLLAVRPEQVDLHVFRARVAEAMQEPDPGRASELLRDALALWRGRALADVGSDWMRERFFPGLEEERLAAIEARIDADLTLGRHAELATELPMLVADNPLRERLRGQLMTALYRCGRRAEALRVFQEARRAVTEELGIEPGPDLQRLHLDILEGRPGATGFSGEAAGGRDQASRNYLPRDVHDFTGREHELRRLTESDVDTAATSRALRVWWLDGPTGVGKTALAIRAAHRLADRYPDGQLFVELHGQSADHSPAAPEAALDALLRALRVPSERIPEGLRERAALWRAELAGRRVLVVLDDAAGEAQVRPLLPGDAGCLVIVTSGQRLSGIEGATRVPLDVLPPEDARTLFSRILGDDRAKAEPDAVTEVVELCGYLPLAIRITGGKLAARPHWPVSRLLRRLRDERQRLDELSVGDLAVRTGLAVTYLGLDEQSRRAYRLLGALGYANLPGWLASPLLDLPEEEAEDVFEQLVDAQLVEVISKPSEPPRYRVHDLVRIHARERAELEDTEEVRGDAVHRAVCALLSTVESLVENLPPAVPRLCQTELSSLPSKRNRTPETDSWFQQEETALITAVERAAELGLAESAAGLAEALVHAWFAVRNRYDGWERTHVAALTAVRGAGLRHAEAALECSLGQMYYKRDNFETAREHFRTALTLFTEAGDARGEAVALNGIGMVYREFGEHSAALPALNRARRMLADQGDEEGVAHALYGIGYSYRELGEDQAALRALDQAAEMYRVVGNERGEALALRGIGLVHRAADDLAAAEEYCECSHRIVVSVDDDLLVRYTAQALAKVRIRRGKADEAEPMLLECLRGCRELHDTFGVALARRTLGECYIAMGEPERALAYLGQALTDWDAIRLPVWRARTLRDVGAAHALTGDADSVERAWSEAAGEFRRLGTREAAEVASWPLRWPRRR